MHADAHVRSHCYMQNQKKSFAKAFLQSLEKQKKQK
jgi:hypothetical protein